MENLTFIGKLPTVLSDDIFDKHWDEYDKLHPRKYPKFLDKTIGIQNIDTVLHVSRVVDNEVDKKIVNKWIKSVNDLFPELNKEL